jgi:hypothetical protein
MWYDFCVSSTRKVPGADRDAKNTPGAGIEGTLLAEPAHHEGGLDEEPENRFRRCSNENFPFNIRYSIHRRLDLGSFFSAARFNRHNPPSQNAVSSARRLAMAD